MSKPLLERCRTPETLYPALEAATQEAVGHRLFTLMAIDHDRGEAARIFSSHPQAYPVGGRKPLSRMTGWGDIVITRQLAWIGYDAEDIQWAFFDHETIAALGCASCLNLPIIDRGANGAPRVIGTMNLLHEAGHYHQEHVATLAPFADLLREPYREWIAASPPAK